MKFERRAWVYIVGNIFCIFLCIPVITAPIGFAALSYMAYCDLNEPTVYPEYFWVGVRKHWRRGLIMGFANIVIGVMVTVNLSTYTAPTLSNLVLRGVWIVTIAVWLAVQMYLWPLIEAMESPSLWGGVRNAALMLLANPLFSLMLLVVLAILIAVSAALVAPIALLTLSLIANIVNSAVSDRLARYRARGAPDG